MPKKKNGKKKYSRPGYGSCGRMVAGDAYKAYKIALSLKRLVNVEIKNFDTQLTASAMTQAPIITQLTNIAIGDTTNSRDGNQCKMIGVDLNYTLLVNATTPRTSVRIMLVVDRQTNQAIYLSTDLLEDITANDGIVTPRNLDNKHRFIVLYDRVHMLSLSVPTLTVRKYIRKDLLLRYDASTSAIADLTQNSLSLVSYTNEATNVPSITAFLRVRFVDN